MTCSGVFIVNFEHISHFVIVFLFVNFGQAIADWIHFASIADTFGLRVYRLHVPFIPDVK